jgi:hypothetical protein
MSDRHDQRDEDSEQDAVSGNHRDKIVQTRILVYKEGRGNFNSTVTSLRQVTEPLQASQLWRHALQVARFLVDESAARASPCL